MHRRALTSLAAAGFLALVPATAHAQARFDPFAGEDPRTYRMDLERNFYTRAEAEREDAGIRAQLTAMADLSRTARTPDEVLRLLARQDTVMRRFGKYLAYLSLRTMLDTRDDAAQQSMNAIQAAANDAFSVVNAQLAAADAELLAPARRAGYGFSLRQLQGPAVSDSAASAAATLTAEAQAWGPSTFRRAMAAADLGKVTTPTGTLDVRRQMGDIWNNADRDIRARGYLANERGLYAIRDTQAHILSRVAALRNESARLLGFADYPTQAYANRFLTRRDVQSMLDGLADSAGVHKAYERLRQETIRRTFGYDTVHVWDLTAPAPGTTAPRLTMAEARRAILAATAPFGPLYAREMSALLDPRNGRLDLLPRDGRVERPGFSTGSVGYPSVFFEGHYDGYVDDVVVLAHEAGHAVQNMLMDHAGVLPRYAGGPAYFTESFALFNEILVLDHLARTSVRPADRVYFRQRLLDQTSGLWWNGWQSLLEQQVFDSASAGHALNADAVERLTQATASRYSIWFGPGSERRLAWMQPLQLYTWPMYRVNYVYAELLALTYYDRMQRNPADFVRGYNVLLSRGYDAPPQELLRRSVGTSLDSQELVARAATVMRRWTEELRAAH